MKAGSRRGKSTDRVYEDGGKADERTRRQTVLGFSEINGNKRFWGSRKYYR